MDAGALTPVCTEIKAEKAVLGRCDVYSSIQFRLNELTIPMALNAATFVTIQNK